MIVLTSCTRRLQPALDTPPVPGAGAAALVTAGARQPARVGTRAPRLAAGPRVHVPRRRVELQLAVAGPHEAGVHTPEGGQHQDQGDPGDHHCGLPHCPPPVTILTPSPEIITEQQSSGAAAWAGLWLIIIHERSCGGVLCLSSGLRRTNISFCKH